MKKLLIIHIPINQYEHKFYAAYISNGDLILGQSYDSLNSIYFDHPEYCGCDIKTIN